jgi:hypothetical protein
MGERAFLQDHPSATIIRPSLVFGPGESFFAVSQATLAQLSDSSDSTLSLPSCLSYLSLVEASLAFSRYKRRMRLSKGLSTPATLLGLSKSVVEETPRLSMLSAERLSKLEVLKVRNEC